MQIFVSDQMLCTSMDDRYWNEGDKSRNQEKKIFFLKNCKETTFSAWWMSLLKILSLSLFFFPFLFLTGSVFLSLQVKPNPAKPWRLPYESAGAAD